MKSKQFIFTALAILWIFFFIVDRVASAVGGVDLLKNRKPLGFIGTALRSCKGLSVFLLIVANVVLLIRPFDKTTISGDIPRN
jgi:hypothetical protein